MHCNPMKNFADHFLPRCGHFTAIKRCTVVFGLVICASACTNEETLGGRGSAGDAGITTDASGADANGGDAKGDGSTWNLTGTINGFSLNDETKSAFLQRSETSTALYTEIVFTTLPNYCALPGANGICAPANETHRILHVLILGAAKGEYTVTEASEPGAGEAFVGIDHLGTEAPGSCTRLSQATHAQSGHVTFTALDASPGGKASLELDVTFPEGRVTGTAVVPLCTFAQ